MLDLMRRPFLNTQKVNIILINIHRSNLPNVSLGIPKKANGTGVTSAEEEWGSPGYPTDNHQRD